METIEAARIVTPEGIVGPARVVIDGDRIAAIEGTAGDPPDLTLAPGFIDLQVNGTGPDDVGSARADWDRLDGALAAQGVTTWCPTLISRPREEYGEALERIGAAARRSGPRPRIAGAHLEGPFLNPEFAGAHAPEFLADPDPEWIESLPPVVRLVTLAPEVPGGIEAIVRLVGHGVAVSLGHSGADAETARAAREAGATAVTHLFNAMGPFHHRSPGLPGAALTDPGLTPMVIADLVHTSAEALALAFAAKRGGIAVVTDAVASAEALEVRDGAPRFDDGTIAGSVLTMDRAVANLVNRVGLPLEVAIAAASTTPARLLGLADRGRIAPGTRADLVALRPDLGVAAVWIGGARVSP